jgi:2-C-methyl-D-erythritol 2,4-cyclodiphosphate synthase
MNVRVGFGYDIHRLVTGRPLFLGGVEVPFTKGLLGHSDGDAAAHALADALLGAAALGDLGAHFPPGDPEWAGASGVRILRRTRELLQARGASFLQGDVTILAEAPRLQEHREAMQKAMSAPLGCDPSALSVKARTNEGMGDVGREEAMAAYAVVLIRLKDD